METLGNSPQGWTHYSAGPDSKIDALLAVKTTKPDPTEVKHPDLVKRVFSSTAPNQLWVTDLTFVPTWAGVAYLCFIIDAYSRMIVGWRVASNMKTETVLDAIEMARWSRGKHLPGLRCHSDAGSQFTSIR